MWEADIIAKYGDCGARHVFAIDAWTAAANHKKK